MIYCVEDERNIRELLIYTLETTGFKARGFGNGNELMKALKEEIPELILLDIMLPEEDGISVPSWRTGSPEPAALYDRSYLEHKDKYSSFLGGNQPLCVLENPAITDGSKLLLIRDSYSDSLAPFLAQRFSEVHLVDLRYYHTSVADYMAEQGIDTTVVLYSVSNFLADRNLIYLAPRG